MRRVAIFVLCSWILFVCCAALWGYSNRITVCDIPLANEDCTASETPVSRSGFEIRNFQQVELAPYGPIKAELSDPLSAGSVKVKCHSVFRSDEMSILFGPDPEQLLHEKNLNVLHRVSLTVANGITVRQVYDIYDPEGDMTYHIDRVAVADYWSIPYAIFCRLGEPTYADHPSRHLTLEFPNVAAFEKAAEQDPGLFIN